MTALPLRIASLLAPLLFLEGCLASTDGADTDDSSLLDEEDELKDPPAAGAAVGGSPGTGGEATSTTGGASGGGPTTQSGGETSASGGQDHQGGGSGGRDHMASDGGAPSGGGSGGQRAVTDECPESTASGGAIYIADCQDWLGERETWPGLPEDCSGEASPSEDVPPLRTLCEFQPSGLPLGVRWCLESIGGSCGLEAEQQVLGCLKSNTSPSCGVTEEFLATHAVYQNECPSLTMGDVLMGLWSPIEEAELLSCLSERDPAEDCVDAFMGCAYEF